MNPLLAQLTEYLTSRSNLRDDWGGIWLTGTEVVDKFDPGMKTGFGYFARKCYERETRASERARIYTRPKHGERRSRFRAIPGDLEARTDHERASVRLPSPLTGRERDVIQGIYSGMKRPAVARWLGISDQRVTQILRSIGQKMVRAGRI